MEENIQLADGQIDEIVLSLLDLHGPEITVDTKEFLDLLKHSLSLNTAEKKRVIDAAPTLSQFQFDELKKVFVEEREKFRELAKQHPEDIKKLLAKQQKEWVELGEIYHREQEQKNLASEDESKIDDIKANLGL
jgi:hypothetical protein